MDTKVTEYEKSTKKTLETIDDLEKNIEKELKKRVDNEERRANLETLQKLREEIAEKQGRVDNFKKNDPDRLKELRIF